MYNAQAIHLVQIFAHFRSHSLLRGCGQNLAASGHRSRPCCLDPDGNVADLRSPERRRAPPRQYRGRLHVAVYDADDSGAMRAGPRRRRLVARPA